MTQILPSKYVPLQKSLLGHASTILAVRRDGQTVSELWATVRDDAEDVSFSVFSAALAMVFTLGGVEIEDGLLVWSSNETS